MNILLVTALIALCLLNVSAENCERNGARCLDYTVLQTHEGYEERTYPSIVWVSASKNGKSKADVSRALIKLLYAYLGGANDRGENLEMMVPVRTAKKVYDGYNSYTMSIALLPEQSENPPVPTNPLVTVVREPETIYVARSFGGQARSDSIWDNEAEALKAFVSMDAAVNTTFYYINVYDSPWRETERLNEVWFKKNDF
ncbi:Heme-binding protein 1, partial [Stegodyphus mimosarum]